MDLIQRSMELSNKKLKKENSPRFPSPPEGSSKNCVQATAAETALDNYLVLKEIFGYLSTEDLKRCCDVNKTWQAIADPMMYDYQITWRLIKPNQVEVRIIKGCINPQIEDRISSTSAETEFLKRLKHPVLLEITLDFEGSYDWNLNLTFKNQLREFITEFGPMASKLAFVWDGYGCAHSFFSRQTNFIGRQYFPKIMEVRLTGYYYGQYFGVVASEMENYPLMNVQVLHLEPFRNTNYNYSTYTASQIFQLMPSVKEIHGVNFDMVQEFEKIGKLDVLPSVVFYRRGILSQKKENNAMQSLSETKLRLKFMFIGLQFKLGSNGLKFINRHKNVFESLLELGKDTLEHLVIRSFKSNPLIEFPSEMSALKQITFRGIGFCSKNVYFNEGDDLSKRFPNVDTLSFVEFSKANWAGSGSWWSPGGMFYSVKFRYGIKYLKSSQPLEPFMEKNLLEKFPSVQAIEIITGNLS